MKIRRKGDGKVFEFDILAIARGEWMWRLVKVDGDPAGYTYTDADFRNEREARADARRFVDIAVYSREYGWHS